MGQSNPPHQEKSLALGLRTTKKDPLGVKISVRESNKLRVALPRFRKEAIPVRVPIKKSSPQRACASVICPLPSWLS